MLTVGAAAAAFADGPAARARFRHPAGLVADAEGNLYIADAGNQRIRKLSLGGDVTTVAGCGQAGWRDGPAPVAQFQFPTGLGVDHRHSGFALLVADYMGHCIRGIDAHGNVYTLAGVPGESGHCDGPADQARFMNPSAVQVGPTGDVFVVDRGNHCVRRIDRDGRTVTTFAGSRRPGLRDGPAATAEFRMPCVCVIDGDGMLWVSDTENHAIRRIDPDGTVTTVAGNGTPGLVDGQGADAQFNCPLDLALDVNGDVVVADTDNHCIRHVTRTGLVTTLLAPHPSPSSPSPAPASTPDTPACPCLQPGGVVLTPFSELIVVDFLRHRLFLLAAGRPAYRVDPRRRALAQQLSDGAGADVVVVAGKQSLPAHRAVLAARSRYFADLLAEVAEGPDPIPLALPDSLAPALEPFLRFLYTGELHSRDHLMELMDACQQFRVDDGSRRCLHYCRRYASPATAIQWLVESHRRGLADVTRCLLQYVSQQWDSIRQTAPQSFNLLQPHPELLEAAIPDHMRLRQRRPPAPRPAFRPLRPSFCPHPVTPVTGHPPDQPPVLWPPPALPGGPPY